ncbi:MAG: DUF3135 domain-containing protein [Methylothermaceae bacterium]|nr:DUF3135 domain-containing protein [Methylothermaceae bacterium]
MTLDSNDFNFDQWMRLAREDPVRFERQRRIAIDAFLETLPPSRQKVLRGLQWRIDMEIRRSRSPLGACIRLYNLMLDAVWQQQSLWLVVLEGEEIPASFRTTNFSMGHNVLSFERPGSKPAERPKGENQS